MHSVRSWAIGMVLPAWLPAGIGAENPPRAKLQPMPKTRSERTRKWAAVRVIVCPLAPIDSGWFSGNALLPAIVVITGA